MSISVSNITKTFGRQIAVNGISFTVKKGEIVGFLGPNGAGKSTTMKMLTGYMNPDSGTIEICGKRIHRDSKHTKKLIGYLPELNPLYTDMYVREFLTFVANVHRLPNVSDKIKQVIELLGIQKEASKKIADLSKGYKQRVGLAAAIMHDPDVLILDEPTSGLDPNQIVEIRQVIKQLGRTKTILFSSHIMQEVEAICDRAIIINKGNIVLDEKLSNLRNTNTSHHTVTFQFKNTMSIDEIQGIEGLVNIHTIDCIHYTVETNMPEILHQRLLEFSVQKGNSIVSLNSEKMALEEIFKSLT